MLEMSWGFGLGGRSRLAFGLALAAIFMIVSPTVVASQAAERGAKQSSNTSNPTVRHLDITVNKSQTITFAAPFKTATIASTEFADVTPLTDRSLYIQGKKVGTTSISVFDQNMQLVELIDLEIDRYKKSAGKNRGSAGGSIRVSSSNGEVVLSGIAPMP